MRKIQDICVGFLGCGTVGTGVLRLLRKNNARCRQLGFRFLVKRIAVKNRRKKRGLKIASRLFTTDPWSVVRDPKIQIVVEVMGGTGLARELVLEALRQGKHVVTANKALLSEHGDEIFAAAKRAGRVVLFEASVCAGVPVIRAIRDGLAADQVTALFGIVNGTANYILSMMTEQGWSYAKALANAQRLGFAEADPILDVGGGDAAHKLAVLVRVAFGMSISERHITTEGISGVEPADLAWAKEFGFRIKMLAIARDHGGMIEVRVHPALVPLDSSLASVGGALNALEVEGRALGRSFYSGLGAGSLPTGVGVVADMMQVAQHLAAGSSGYLPSVSDSPRPRSILNMGRVKTRYYLRLSVADKLGVLAPVTAVFAKHGISIAEFRQKLSRKSGHATLVFLTHRAREEDVQSARGKIDTRKFTLKPMQLFRIEDDKQ
ncbi:MAG: homoserine dehydrogenase [bacterium]|nr:homoserine dehydrogenase [bacterium]